MEKYLGYDNHLRILGEKLNNYKQPHSIKEARQQLKDAEEWINKHKDEKINFYNI